jgi:hypothetical protein
MNKVCAALCSGHKTCKIWNKIYKNISRKTSKVIITPEIDIEKDEKTIWELQKNKSKKLKEILNNNNIPFTQKRVREYEEEGNNNPPYKKRKNQPSPQKRLRDNEEEVDLFSEPPYKKRKRIRKLSEHNPDPVALYLEDEMEEFHPEFVEIPIITMVDKLTKKNVMNYLDILNKSNKQVFFKLLYFTPILLFVLLLLVRVRVRVRVRVFILNFFFFRVRVRVFILNFFFFFF